MAGDYYVERFANGHQNQLFPSAVYSPAPYFPEISAQSNKDFLSSRSKFMQDLFYGDKTQESHEFSQALALEYLVQLALKDLLCQGGFRIDLSPQSLERSTPQALICSLLIKRPI